MNTINYKAFLLPCIILVLLLLLYLNRKTLFPFYEALSLTTYPPAPAPPDERTSYNDNKEQTSKITTLTYNTKLNNVTSQISECQNLIDEINSILPRNVKDIQINNVTQTDKGNREYKDKKVFLDQKDHRVKREIKVFKVNGVLQKNVINVKFIRSLYLL